ncbi:hypothetical protein L0F63_006245 [Massospora cicadina]|nr:hypothetical protein L0F63_006245 [Massospora cicadina]
MSESGETVPLLSSRTELYCQSDERCPAATLTTFTLSTVLLFSSPILIGYTDLYGAKDFDTCEQRIKETFLIGFRVVSTSHNFKLGNYTDVQLVSLGTTTPPGELPPSEILGRHVQLANSILNSHSGNVIINKIDDGREKEYIIEFIGSCRQELTRAIFNQTRLRLTHRQKYRIRRWRDGRGTGAGIKGAKSARPSYELITAPENRIDVVFMGDGYASDERGKFIADINRLSAEMFEGETFQSWLPLINVWAVYIPSKESGIGVGGKPKDTPFGLYRDGTELRGIYTSKPKVAKSICEHLGSAICDFPSLIANDDFYGVSAGRSGTVVLRHEMGHTFDEIGEEYDGGEVYEGVNSANKLSNLPWAHWLSQGRRSTHLREERNHVVFQYYAWHDLTKDGPYVVNFTTSGKFPRWYLQISTSGMATEGSFSLTLDGAELPWSPPGTLDRTFSTWFNATHALSKGRHQLRFQAKEGLPVEKVIHQLCNLELIEYAGEDKFKWDDPGHIGAYPTFSHLGEKSYRPTNEFCLMRNMSSRHFCSVCKEGLWLKFLDRISLLDELNIRLVRFPASPQPLGIVPQPSYREIELVSSTDPACEVEASFKREVASGYLVQAKLLELAKLPKGTPYGLISPNLARNEYKIRWFHNSSRVHVLDGQTTFLVHNASPYAVGAWEVFGYPFDPSGPQGSKPPSHRP